MQIDPRLNEIDSCLYRLAVKAFIFHEGKVLLVREKDDEWWSFPGGGIDYGEDIEQALPRELAEELGVPPTKIGTDYRVVYVGIGNVVHGVPRANLFYRVEVLADHLRATDEVLEFGWFTPAEVASLYATVSAMHTAKLQEALEAELSKGVVLTDFRSEDRKSSQPARRPSVADRKSLKNPSGFVRE